MQDFVISTDVDVKSQIVQALQPELVKRGYSAIKVIKADPQSQSEIPCVGINRIDDSEDSQTLSNASGSIYDSSTSTNHEFSGTFFSEALEIRIWHTNADERDKLYRVVRAVLFAMRDDLTNLGLLNISLRSGRDEQDSSMQQAPMVLYWTTITMSYLNPLEIDFQTVVSAISAVDSNPTLTAG